MKKWQMTVLFNEGGCDACEFLWDEPREFGLACKEALERLFDRYEGKTIMSVVTQPAAEEDAPIAPEPRSDLRAFWRQQAAWSQSVFGKDSERGPIGPLKHLAKEAAEAQEKPNDLMEFVDCLFLTFDATRRAGFTFDQLCEAAWQKLEINKARTWNKPTSNEAVEHVRTP